MLRSQLPHACGTSILSLSTAALLARSGPPDPSHAHISGNCGKSDVADLTGFDLTLLTGKNIALTPIDTSMTGHNSATIHESTDINAGCNGADHLSLTGYTANPLNLTTTAAMHHRLEVGAHGFDGSVTGAANFGCIDGRDLGHDIGDVGCLHREDPQRLHHLTACYNTGNGTTVKGFDGKTAVTARRNGSGGGLIDRTLSDLGRAFADMAGLVKGAFAGTGASFACAA